MPVSNFHLCNKKTVDRQLNSGEVSKFLENSEFLNMIKLFNENGFYHECSQWIYELLSNNPRLDSRKQLISRFIVFLFSSFWKKSRLRIHKSESEASLANRFAFGCFQKADVDIKLDNSNTMDDWERLSWSFAKPRFYNGSPLIEVNHAIIYGLQTN